MLSLAKCGIAGSNDTSNLGLRTVLQISHKPLIMKIAVIGAKGLPAKQGGIEHHCQELYSRIFKQGHSVDLFARSSYTESLHHYDVRGIRVIPLPSVKFKGVDALLCSALAGVASSRKHYDIVNFHALGPALFSWLPKFASSSKLKYIEINLPSF